MPAVPGEVCGAAVTISGLGFARKRPAGAPRVVRSQAAAAPVDAEAQVKFLKCPQKFPQNSQKSAEYPQRTVRTDLRVFEKFTVAAPVDAQVKMLRSKIQHCNFCV